MPITIQSIYRYPIKGFTPQSLEEATIIEGKPLPGDRAFAIENGESGFDPENPEHLSKIHFLMLMKQPELAAVKTDVDPETGAFSMSHDGKVIATGNLFEPASLTEAFLWLQNFCKSPLRGAPRVLHAADHAFTDSRTQDITLINLASVAEISKLAGAELDPLRFRGNFYIEGAEPWQEHDWLEGTITIGGSSFKVRKRTKRCAATNANPESGERDQSISSLLLEAYDHADCGIHLMPLTSGAVAIGDILEIQ